MEATEGEKAVARAVEEKVAAARVAVKAAAARAANRTYVLGILDICVG